MSSTSLFESTTANSIIITEITVREMVEMIINNENTVKNVVIFAFKQHFSIGCDLDC